MSEIIKKVRKRDGTIVDFDKERITNAIFAAAKEVGGRDRRTAERLADEVVRVLEERYAGQIPSVEDIQDVVEKVLIERGHAKTAKAYIIYRKQHEELRKIKSTFLEVEKVVDDYLGMRDWRVRENSNMDYSLSGLLFHIANSVIANYTLDKVYPMEVAAAHTNGDMHIHDLGMGICGYCVKPDTLILGDNKAISEYKPSDRVLGCSHLQRVTEVFERHFSGRLVKIRACGTLPMEVTPEHPILVALKGVSGSHKNESYRWIPASALRPRIERKRVYMVIPRLRGTESDEILDLTPFAKKKSVKVKMLPLSESTAWLLGLYVAEGYSYVGPECRTRFCLGKGETELISRVENTLKGLGLRYRRINLKTSVHIELRYSALARALKEWCGGNALSKRIPEFILLHERREILEAFLAGYVAGDGSEQKKEKSGKSWYGKRTRMYTASKLLALQLQLLCARLGIFASISRDARKSRGMIQGRKVNSHDIFVISFYSRGSKYAHILKDVILTPLRETEEVEYEGPVCNLETEDNTYLVSNMVVHNCAGWSLSQLLAEGFNGVPGKVASKPPAHLDTALLQMANFIGSLQNEWAGAQAFNSVDTLLAPFVRKDGLNYNQVKQAIQTFVFNLNIASRWGGQTPFTNITLDLTVPEDYKDKHVIIGGRLGDDTYEDYTEEMEMINRAFIEVMMEGDMRGRPFTFPIPTYSLTRDFEWDNGISSELFEMTAKYGLPYFQNFINSDLRPSDVRSMCCRLRLDLRELRRNVTGGLFGSGDSTGSVGVVTINMPRLGYLSKNEDEFFDRLDYVMYLAKLSLEAKREMVTKNMESGLLPFTKRYLGTLDHHFSTIGLVGMNEALLNLFGYGIATEEGKKFAIRTLKFMLDRIRQFQEETGHIYNLEATPAEGVSYRLARIDKKKYPDIITAGEKTPYYTNSTTLPVNSGIDLISALKHQEDLQTLYTGGTVFHMFIGESLEDGESCKNLIKKVAHKTRLPYFTVTPTYTICENHGFMPGEYPTCPSCGGSTEVYSRVVGYFRPVRNWNAGKQEEFRQRIEYT